MDICAASPVAGTCLAGRNSSTPYTYYSRLFSTTWPMHPFDSRLVMRLKHKRVHPGCVDLATDIPTTMRVWLKTPSNDQCANQFSTFNGKQATQVRGPDVTTDDRPSFGYSSRSQQARPTYELVHRKQPTFDGPQQSKMKSRRQQARQELRAQSFDLRGARRVSHVLAVCW